MKRFWLVGRVDSDGKLESLSHEQHFIESAARALAETWSRSNPGTRYVVLEAVDTVRKTDIAWEPCYDSLPF